MKPKTIHKKIIVLGVVFILCASSYSVQRQIDTKERQTFGDYLFLSFRSGDYLKSVALGFDVLIADLIWAHTVVDFGERFVTNQDYTGLYHRLNLITTLDPLFNEAYRYGSILLAMQAEEVDQSIMLLERGLKNFPDNWRLYFTMGFNYTFYKNDDATAISHFERAAALPGSPKYLSRLIGNLYAETGKVDMALVFLEEAHKQLKDPKMRAEIAEKMKELLRERQALVREDSSQLRDH